ncbi:MAG: HEAT repeat domain-containing protein [Phycisphaerales bacterium]|nr:HEAT repeat domain-containing protein [Phycisphaerales bacterium]
MNMMQTAVRVVPVVGVLSLLGPAGCVMEDFNDIGQTFFSPSPTEAARDALDPYNPDLRREGVVLLSNAPFGGVEAYLKMYRDYVVNDPNPLVRAAAITALARHGDESDAILISPYLSREAEPNETVRWYAALALQRLHDPEVIGVLETAMRDEDETGEIRAAVCVALGQYPEDRVVQLLLLALDARELAVNTEAAQSLMLLTGQEFGLDRVAWQNWYNAALAKKVAFKDQREYFYPTYSRDTDWWEYAAFWLDMSWEKPSAPAGRRPESERRTYEEPPPEVRGDEQVTEEVETADNEP